MKNSALTRISGFIESTSVAFMNIAMWGVLGLMILISVEVFSRYVFNSSLLVTDEISAYILLFVCFVGAAGTLKEKRHITVDIVIDRLRPRVQIWLRLIMSIISICFLCIFCWHTFVMIRTSFIRGVRIPSVMLTLEWIPQSIILVGTVLLILQFFVEIGKQLQEIKGQHEKL